jgi:hypothetical protein
LDTKEFISVLFNKPEGPIDQRCSTFLTNGQHLEAKNVGGQIFGSKAHGGHKNTLLITILTIEITLILHFYEEFLLQKSWRAFDKSLLALG